MKWKSGRALPQRLETGRLVMGAKRVVVYARSAPPIRLWSGLLLHRVR